MTTGLEVTRVKNARELELVHKLTHDTYVDRGLISQQKNGLWINYPELDVHEESLIFLAKYAGKYIGTISMTHITQVEDFYNYSTFQEEYDTIWDSSIGCFSAWRLATSGSSSMQMLLILRLMLEVHIQADIHHWPRVFFCFLPEHESIYRKVFPSGKVLGRQIKSKDGIHSELILFTYDSYPEGRAHLEQLVAQLERRLLKLAG